MGRFSVGRHRGADQRQPAGWRFAARRRAPAARPPAPNTSSSWRPRLPVIFPPLKSLDAFPGNLPVQLTTFVAASASWPKSSAC